MKNGIFSMSNFPKRFLCMKKRKPNMTSFVRAADVVFFNLVIKSKYFTCSHCWQSCTVQIMNGMGETQHGLKRQNEWSHFSFLLAPPQSSCYVVLLCLPWQLSEWIHPVLGLLWVREVSRSGQRRGEESGGKSEIRRWDLRRQKRWWKRYAEANVWRQKR